MFDLTLTLMGGDEHGRKPLKHLTKSHGNRMMFAAPLKHTQMYPPVHSATIEENVQVQREHHILYSPRMLHSGINRPRLYTEFNGTGHHSFDPDNAAINPQVSFLGENNRLWLYTEFNRTGHHNFGPDIAAMNPQVSYAQHEYDLQQDGKIQDREWQHIRSGSRTKAWKSKSN